jgi:hypothetical protein
VPLGTRTLKKGAVEEETPQERENREEGTPSQRKEDVASTALERKER